MGQAASRAAARGITLLLALRRQPLKIAMQADNERMTVTVESALDLPCLAPSLTRQGRAELWPRVEHLRAGSCCQRVLGHRRLSTIPAVRPPQRGGCRQLSVTSCSRRRGNDLTM